MPPSASGFPTSATATVLVAPRRLDVPFCAGAGGFSALGEVDDPGSVSLLAGEGASEVTAAGVVGALGYNNNSIEDQW